MGVLTVVDLSPAPAGFAGAVASAARLRVNDCPPLLVEAAVRCGEGTLAAGGAVAVDTRPFTGRTPKDKFIVNDVNTGPVVWWEANQSMAPEAFDRLMADLKAYAEGRDLYVQKLSVAADPTHRIPVTVITELAWHGLFARNLLMPPIDGEDEAGLTIIDLPGFRCDPARHQVNSEAVIACDFTRRVVLIGGTAYAGEIKKSAFTYLNYVLPASGVLPMHCSANVGHAGDAAIFFGLSGTGKTTLSTDPERPLVGDDEHGWGGDGVFNFEGGCYAKTIRLSAEDEPEIHAACGRFGTVLENVVVDPATRVPDFDDGTLAENSRAAYPLEAIHNAVPERRAGHPKSVVFLTADAFGVMPPIARLSPDQALYYFLSGYTAKVAGTERGVSDPTATFSTCFAKPFLPRHPTEYAKLLGTLIERHDSSCWLVNTGWTGGPTGVGHRMPIRVTRTLLSAALHGSLEGARFAAPDPVFGLAVPEAVAGVEPQLLTPRRTWSDGVAFDRQAARLATMFADNFRQFSKHVGPEVRDAGPQPNARVEA